MDKIRLNAEVLKTENRPEVWTVEAIDDQSGDVFSAMFVGPKARERAEEYAAEKFAEHRVSAAAYSGLGLLHAEPFTTLAEATQYLADLGVYSVVYRLRLAGALYRRAHIIFRSFSLPLCLPSRQPRLFARISNT